jgi:hypothetical protein
MALTLAIACGSAPNSPTAGVGSLTSPGAAPVVTSTGTHSTVDFASCLSGSTDPACHVSIVRASSVASSPLVLDAPSNLTATVTGVELDLWRVTLTWNAPNLPVDVITGYVFEGGLGPAGGPFTTRFQSQGAGTTYTTMVGSPGTYHVRVRAVSGPGDISDPSNDLT